MNMFDEFEVILEADEAELEDSTESSWVVHTPPKRRQMLLRIFLGLNQIVYYMKVVFKQFFFGNIH